MKELGKEYKPTESTTTSNNGESFGEKLAKNVGTSALTSAALTLIFEGVKRAVKVLARR